MRLVDIQLTEANLRMQCCWVQFKKKTMDCSEQARKPLLSHQTQPLWYYIDIKILLVVQSVAISLGSPAVIRKMPLATLL